MAAREDEIDAAEHAHTREIEALGHLPKDSPALSALRTQIVARFTELEAESTQIKQRLAVLTPAVQLDQDPTLLDDLPVLGDVLTGAAPPVQAQLLQALEPNCSTARAGASSPCGRPSPSHPRRRCRYHRTQRTRRHRRSSGSVPLATPLDSPDRHNHGSRGRGGRRLPRPPGGLSPPRCGLRRRRGQKVMGVLTQSMTRRESPELRQRWASVLGNVRQSPGLTRWRSTSLSQNSTSPSST